jgi:hypothetical protein
MLDFAAAADASIAKDAGFVIHRNSQRSVVLATFGKAFGETGLRDAVGGGKEFEFTVLRMDVAGTGRRMVRHEQFYDRFPYICHLGGIGGDNHLIFGRPDAGGGENPPPSLNYANAADADRRFILLVTQGWDGNAVQTSGIEDRRTCRYGNGASVDCQTNVGHSYTSLIGQTPSGQR